MLFCQLKVEMGRGPKQGHLDWEVEIMVTHRLPRVGTGPELLGAGNCLVEPSRGMGHLDALTHHVSGSSITASIMVWGEFQLQRQLGCLSC